MKWLDITGPRQATAECISREDWALIVKAQPTYVLADVKLVDATLYDRCAPEPGEPPDPIYEERIAAARLLATGVSWYEAALWCNALSAELGLKPAYDIDGITDRVVPIVARSRGKLTMADLEVAPGAKGVRLLTEKDYREAAKVIGFTTIPGIYEWGEEWRRAPYVFESLVLGGIDGTLCNSIFKLSWNAFRVVKG